MREPTKSTDIPMKKILIGIFAHPDDEAFGPAGTLLSEARSGTELHLITLTAGQHGTNPDGHADLGATRLQEWYKAGELIGASSMHHLGFVDGTLDNISMIKATEQILQIIDTIRTSHIKPYEIEIMSMDTNGISGHIDHIVASRSAHQIYYTLKDQGIPVSRLRLACIPRSHTGNTPDTSFVFMEPGRPPEEIDEIIDNRNNLEDIVAIMRTHHTQRADCEHHLDLHGDSVAVDHFIVKT